MEDVNILPEHMNEYLEGRNLEVPKIRAFTKEKLEKLRDEIESNPEKFTSLFEELDVQQRDLVESIELSKFLTKIGPQYKDHFDGINPLDSIESLAEHRVWRDQAKKVQDNMIHLLKQQVEFLLEDLETSETLGASNQDKSKKESVKKLLQAIGETETVTGLKVLPKEKEISGDQ